MGAPGVYPMDWLPIALISVVMFAFVTVLDKRLIVDYFPGVLSFNAAVGLWNLVTAVIILAFAIPILGMPSAQAVWVSLLAGLFWAGGLTLFFYGLRLEEVSRATSIWLSAPIFASVLAVMFLDEHLSAAQWASVLAVVAGAGLMSVRPGRGIAAGINRRALGVLVLAAALTGAAFVVNKEATNLTDVWTAQGLRNITMGLGIFAFSYRPGVLTQAVDALKKPRAMLVFAGAEGITAPIAAVLVVFALSAGPASLVSTVNSARPLFVLALSVALSTRYWNVLNEPLDRDTLVLKIVATAVIVGGVSGLALA